jgi:hypothetical protein
MLFGREMRLPFDVALLPKPSLGKDAETHMKSLLGHLKVVKQIAHDNIEASQQKDKAHKDMVSSEPQFHIGQQVWLHNAATKKGLSPKLSQKWIGPYYITQIGPNHTFKIHRSSDNQEHKSMVHADRLKPKILRVTSQQPNAIHDHQAKDPIDDSRSSDPTKDTPSQPQGKVIDTSQTPPTNIPERLISQQQGRTKLSLDASIIKPTSASSSSTIAPSTTHAHANTHNSNAPTQTQQQYNTRHKHISDLDARKCSLPPSQDQAYPVEKVLKSRKMNGIRHYLVKWVGHKTPTWEPQLNLGEGLVKDFHIRKTNHGRARKRKQNLRYFK